MMRHKIRLIKPGVKESESKFDVNVPAGVFISPQHAWAKIESNGTVRVGPDDLVRKLFEKIDQVELPPSGKTMEKGDTLFSLNVGDFNLKIPSPISGKITVVNTEHADRPEWLAIKPFNLTWMCGIEPSNLATELPDLMIGRDAISWYENEIGRYHELADKFIEHTADLKPDNTDEDEVKRQAEYKKLLIGFSKPFLQV
jgi:glycine cleavage system H protein